ncbi:MAG: tetratricopeptide repeat protein [Chloroflexi bacterium]|nr:tetratricopeptide repeat protein [Chloroflexota bacterium]
MPDREEDKARLRRKASQEAISLAMQSRWQEAVTVNQSILELFPTDIDAYNRLGRAFMELGEFAKAKEAYSRGLELDPNNAIAQKNLQRLSLLPASKVKVKEERREVAPDLFIGEMGKAGVVNLQNLAPGEVLARMAAGNQVDLKVRGQQLIIENEQGEYLGLVEPPHGFRLARLIEGGNKYTAAIVNIDNDTARVIIREVFQHPNQIGRPSFPVKAVEGFQPHVKDTLLRHEAVEEEALEEGEEVELEEGELIPEGFSIFEGVPPDEETMIEEEFMGE